MWFLLTANLWVRVRNIESRIRDRELGVRKWEKEEIK